MKGMPWRTPPHFSITRRTIAAESDWAAEIWEKSKERVGLVKLGFEGLELGFGFLRWWSLIKAWNFSEVRVSAGDSSILGTTVSSSSAASFSRSSFSRVAEVEEEEKVLKQQLDRGERNC